MIVIQNLYQYLIQTRYKINIKIPVASLIRAGSGSYTRTVILELVATLIRVGSGNLIESVMREYIAFLSRTDQENEARP